MKDLHILIAEESQLIAKMLASYITQETGMSVIIAETWPTAEHELKNATKKFTAVISSVELRGGEPEATLNLSTSMGIPTIVLTSSFDSDFRRKLLNKKIAGYILKRPECLEQVIYLIRRILSNRGRTALIVDDSSTSRAIQRDYLSKLKLDIAEAASADEALQMIQQSQSISIVLTDYVMPDKNGVELTSEIRKSRPKDQLSIIGLSATDDPSLSIRFLKAGASDFLRKPFQEEEYHCRVLQNLETLDLIQATREMANHDYLTKLPNRHHFFNTAPQSIEQTRQKGIPVWIALMDLDKFKSINDNYGHQAGDDALKATAHLLRKHFATALAMARYGGEEFIIVGAGSNPLSELESFRKDIECNSTPSGSINLRFTVSIGIQFLNDNPLESAIHSADLNLYEAKNEGRNRIVIK